MQFNLSKYLINFFMKNLPQQLKGIAIATVFFIGLLYVQAWTGAPAGIPPANNVDAPINVSNSTQYKPGSLGIGGLFKVYGTFNIPTGAGPGKVLTSDADGNASWQTPVSSSGGGSAMVSDSPQGTLCGLSVAMGYDGIPVSPTIAATCKGYAPMGNGLPNCPSGYTGVTANVGGYLVYSCAKQ